MTAFLYLTDSHLGFPGFEYAFCHHPGRADLVPELIARLALRLSQEPAEMIFHGGDMVHNGSASEIEQAVELWKSAPLPVKLCAGNHDLRRAGGFDRWRKKAPDMYPVSDNGHYSIEFDDCTVCVLTNTYGNRLDADGDFIWAEKKYELIQPPQLEELEHTLLRRKHLPAVVIAHAPTFGVDISWADPEKAVVHPVTSDWVQRLNGVLNRYPNVKLVLGGHNHITASQNDDDVRIRLTTGAFMEPPYACRHISINSKRLVVQTWSVADEDDIGGVFLAGKKWTWGRNTDREIQLSF